MSFQEPESERSQLGSEEKDQNEESPTIDYKKKSYELFALATKLSERLNKERVDKLQMEIDIRVELTKEFLALTNHLHDFYQDQMDCRRHSDDSSAVGEFCSRIAKLESEVHDLRDLHRPVSEVDKQEQLTALQFKIAEVRREDKKRKELEEHLVKDFEKAENSLRLLCRAGSKSRNNEHTVPEDKEHKKKLNRRTIYYSMTSSSAPSNSEKPGDKPTDLVNSTSYSPNGKASEEPAVFVDLPTWPILKKLTNLDREELLQCIEGRECVIADLGSAEVKVVQGTAMFEDVATSPILEKISQNPEELVRRIEDKDMVITTAMALMEDQKVQQERLMQDNAMLLQKIKALEDAKNTSIFDKSTVEAVDVATSPIREKISPNREELLRRIEDQKVQQERLMQDNEKLLEKIKALEDARNSSKNFEKSTVGKVKIQRQLPSARRTHVLASHIVDSDSESVISNRSSSEEIGRRMPVVKSSQRKKQPKRYTVKESDDSSTKVSKDIQAQVMRKLRPRK